MAFEYKMPVAALGNLVCIILCGFALGIYYLFLALLAKYFKETTMNEFQSAFEYQMALAAWGNLVCSLLCGFALGLYFLFLALLAKYMEMKSASRNHSTDRTTTSPGPTSPRHCTDEPLSVADDEPTGSNWEAPMSIPPEVPIPETETETPPPDSSSSPIPQQQLRRSARITANSTIPPLPPELPTPETPPPSSSPSPIPPQQLRHSARITANSTIPTLRRSPRLALMPRVSYVGMC